MKTLNYKQLAFVLDIPIIEAIEKMVFVNSKVTGSELIGPYDKVTEYIKAGAAQSIEISVLADCLNIPGLQQAVDDIRNNYLKRSASKKWILNDYPEHQLALKKEKRKIKIPSVLASMLQDSDLAIIREEWHKRHGL